MLLFHSFSNQFIAALCFLVVCIFMGTFTACTYDTALPDLENGIPCPENTVIFVTEILPVITANCAYSGCHDAATAADDIVLDNYKNIRKEVKVGDPEDSELYENLAGITDDEDDKMPPDPYSPLSTEQIQTIYDWIKQGAENIICGTGECDVVEVSFANTIYPIMQTSCINCHDDNLTSAGVNLKDYAHIRLYALNGALEGCINGNGAYAQMPPSGSLSNCKIDQISSWISQGALDN
ncbi:MAG: c-type cytochrome domain-containing protein [Chitinophagales bacterium]